MQENRNSSDSPKKLKSKIGASLFGKDCDVETLFQEGISMLLNPKNIDDWMAAESCLTRASKEGHVGAQVQLGRMLSSRNPFNGQCDLEKASFWFKTAAEQGDAEGMMDFGMVLFTGEGVTRDPVEGLQWVEKAAALEHPGAMTALGTFYLRGCEGYDKDYSKGLEMLQKAYLNDSAEASFLLGMLYLQGHDVPRNIPLGIEYLKSASKNDLVIASYHLGILHMTGQLVKQNKKAAAKWFTKSAESGHAPSQYAIGMMRLGGDGIRQDVASADYWIGTAYQATEGSVYGLF